LLGSKKRDHMFSAFSKWKWNLNPIKIFWSLLTYVGGTPTSFHAVATIKYIFPQAMQNNQDEMRRHAGIALMRGCVCQCARDLEEALLWAQGFPLQ
jgi:hypothetical protein